jgi:hypothetical protein
MISFRKKCPEAIADLAELYLLKRLPLDDNRELEEHLLSCCRCMDILEETEHFFTSFRDAYASFDAELPPPVVDSCLQPTLVVGHSAV